MKRKKPNPAKRSSKAKPKPQAVSNEEAAKKQTTQAAAQTVVSRDPGAAENQASAQTAAPVQPGAPETETGKQWDFWNPNPLVVGVGLIVVLLLVYWPALNGGFLWDDDTHISANPTLRSLKGLADIWFSPGATSQYYPLTFSVFWIEFHLWGLHPLGYHIINVLLHGTVAILLWQILQRLKVRGAWLAGAIFALHPVCVMSVAWMTELKNTFSATLALCAAWAYVRAAGLGVYAGADNESKWDWGFYGLSLFLFLMAMLAKTAVSFLPVTLLLVTWWCGRRLNWRTIWPVLPMVAVAVGMGLLTMHVEQSPKGGAHGAQFEIPVLNRILISGRSFWFYLGKLFFPRNLTFIYERWNINTGALWQYLFPAATLAALVISWLLRSRIGRGLSVALTHFFVSTSLLVLIFTLFFTQFSYVSDHWQYFGCMSVIAATAAGMVWVLDELGRNQPMVRPVLCGALFLLLAGLSWRQCGNYASDKKLWLATLAQNPNSTLALNNYGTALVNERDFTNAMITFDKLISLAPDDTLAHYNLASALLQNGQFGLAALQYERVLQLDPNVVQAHSNLGLLLLSRGRVDEAIGHFQKALQVQPNDPTVHYNLATAFEKKKDFDGAIAEIETVIKISPDDYDSRCYLAQLFFEKGDVDGAVERYRQIQKIAPDYAPAQDDFVQMVWALATSSDDAVRNGTKALELAKEFNQKTGGKSPLALCILAAAQAECGSFEDAVATGEQAKQLATQGHNQSLADALDKQIALYRSNRPIRQDPPTATHTASGGGS